MTTHNNLSQKSLSLEELAQQFASAPKEYSPVPIWWWSGDKLERSRLRWQMQQLIAGGIYNVVILNLAPSGPLYGSDPDRPLFLTDEWWDIFLGVCEDAQELGMRIWFYDQIGFSGANLQGILVRETPGYAGQALESIIIEGTGTLELVCPAEGEPLAAAYIPLDDNGNTIGVPVTVPLDGRVALTDAPMHKRLRLMYAIQRGFDYFNTEACARLLDMVHIAFEKKAGRFFGSVIVGSFQDELPSLLSWGGQFAADFQRIKGYDVRETLMSLWEGEDAESARIRVDYHAVRAELAENAIFRPFFDWHEKHGLICGFDQQSPARTGQPTGTVRQYADYMRTHRWYGAPGSDHHGQTRIHSSLAHLYERPRTWIESFHSSGWGGTLEETFDWLLPWLRTGATLYDPHAVYYSTWAGWWEWAPPSTCWRQPYWRHYSIFSTAITRLCYLLSQGKHVCDIGVLYPTTTVQSGLTVEHPLDSARTASDVTEALTGTMMFMDMKPGVLDKDGRDYDLLDDESIQRAGVHNGALEIAGERYSIVVLPASTVLEGATAAQLVLLVENGGTLVAVGKLPEQIIGGDENSLQSLRNLFASGKAKFIARADELPSLLSAFTRRIEAPVPVLHRRIDGRDVVYVPSAFPHATRSEDPNATWLKANYSFDPARYDRNMKIRLRGFGDKLQLWDALSGERRHLPVHMDGDTAEVEIPFDSGPAALIVRADDAVTISASPQATETIFEFPQVWDCQLESTLDNRYGDFNKPDSTGAVPVQTWRFQHWIEPGKQVSPENLPAPDQWQTVNATFGVYGWSYKARSVAELPGPFPQMPPNAEPLAEGWTPAVYSLQRGIHKDPLHEPNLGPKGHVPEEFLHFGQCSAGEGIQFRTAIWMDTEQTLTLAIGAAAQKSAWVNGQSLGADTSGYLWLTPVKLQKGANLLEFRLIAEQEVDLRAYWSLVMDAAAFARPERITPPDAPKKDSRLAFLLTFDVPFTPAEFVLQVSADSPCRISLNGVEAGRQGGFDPYASLARVQSYPIGNCQAGSNTLMLEVQDTGTPAAVLADGLIHGANGEKMILISGTHWQVQRDEGAVHPVTLYRPQWLDPAWSHLWRRAHPLPGAMWIEAVPADTTVLPVIPRAHPRLALRSWLQWKLPPGAVRMHLPVAGEIEVWIDGAAVIPDGQTVVIPASSTVERKVLMRVLPSAGQTGGGVFTAPVTYETDKGLIQYGDWCQQGLEAYSGGVRYQTTFTLENVAAMPLILDLGRVRGTAGVWINGQSVGAKVWSPYQFDVTNAVKAGANTVEILVLNTLAPYLDAVSPTHYIRPGQTVSGLFGPVQLKRKTVSP